jgi:hypothetical protein
MSVYTALLDANVLYPYRYPSLGAPSAPSGGCADQGGVRAGSSGPSGFSMLFFAPELRPWSIWDAKPLMRRALAIDEASFGSDHPKVAQPSASTTWPNCSRPPTGSRTPDTGLMLTFSFRWVYGPCRPRSEGSSWSGSKLAGTGPRQGYGRSGVFLSVIGQHNQNSSSRPRRPTRLSVVGLSRLCSQFATT